MGGTLLEHAKPQCKQSQQTQDENPMTSAESELSPMGPVMLNPFTPPRPGPGLVPQPAACHNCSLVGQKSRTLQDAGEQGSCELQSQDQGPQSLCQWKDLRCLKGQAAR